MEMWRGSKRKFSIIKDGARTTGSTISAIGGMSDSPDNLQYEVSSQQIAVIYVSY